MAKSEETTPNDVRESVRSGILAAIERDVELRGGRTARRLLAAGFVGVLGALGITLLVSRHPFGHHPSWHVVVFSTVWAGVLVVGCAMALLGVRTPSLPLARSATVGLLGVGLAGLCGAACPDQHFLRWWSGTATGATVTGWAGLAASASCLGLVATASVSAIAAALVLDQRRERVTPLVPTAMLVALLAPGVALQSVGTSIEVLSAWLAGTAAGAYSGVAVGSWLRAQLPARRSG